MSTTPIQERSGSDPFPTAATAIVINDQPFPERPVDNSSHKVISDWWQDRITVRLDQLEDDRISWARLNLPVIVLSIIMVLIGSLCSFAAGTWPQVRWLSFLAGASGIVALFLKSLQSLIRTQRQACSAEISSYLMRAGIQVDPTPRGSRNSPDMRRESIV
jgi:hypothetical protein